MEYQCWGEDMEDLTDKVRQAIAALPSNEGPVVVYGVMRVVGREPPRGPQKILVSCGKGHENVFMIDGAAR